MAILNFTMFVYIFFFIHSFSSFPLLRVFVRPFSQSPNPPILSFILFVVYSFLLSFHHLFSLSPQSYFPHCLSFVTCFFCSLSSLLFPFICYPFLRFLLLIIAYYRCFIPYFPFPSSLFICFLHHIPLFLPVLPFFSSFVVSFNSFFSSPFFPSVSIS